MAGNQATVRVIIKEANKPAEFLIAFQNFMVRSSGTVKIRAIDAKKNLLADRDVSKSSMPPRITSFTAKPYNLIQGGSVALTWSVEPPPSDGIELRINGQALAVDKSATTASVQVKDRVHPRSAGRRQVRGSAAAAHSELASCAVRVVIANKVADDEGGGVLLSLEAEPQQTLAAKNVPPGTTAKTSVVLRSKTLCDYLASALRPDKPVAPQFRLSTTTRERKVEIFGKVEDDRSLAPRLMLTYTLAGALPGDADWSQIRRDAQHSGRSAWRLYDPAGAYSPTGFAISPVGTTRSARMTA